MADSDPHDDRLAERLRMVEEQIVRRGVRDTRVIEALQRVPRERFIPPESARMAYRDSALPIECQQTISQPYMVARMTELLELKPEDRVLEIGTGSGYQTAILGLLSGHVYTVEWHLKLSDQAANRLEESDCQNVTFRCGDGSVGWPAQGPFDAILVTAGAPHVPDVLCEQLKPGGRLVIPAGGMDDQALLRLVRTPTGFQREEHMRCRFVKLLGVAGWRT